MDQYDITISAKLTSLTLFKRLGVLLIALGCKLNGYQFKVK